jgi:stage V sporulation protein AA
MPMSGCWATATSCCGAWLLAAAAWLLLFVGAAVTILNFHADVNMPAVHREIYRLLTGRTAAHPLLLEIPYAVGVGVGIVVFLRPRRGEPGPLELEAARYERGLHAYLRERP